MDGKKYGTDLFGQWSRDENSLPCYALNLQNLPPLCPPLNHLIGTGKILLLADQYGKMNIITGGPGFPCSLNAPGPSSFSALHMLMICRNQPRQFFVENLPQSQPPSMSWGIGYVQYAATLTWPGNQTLAVTLKILAPVQQDFFVLSLEFQNKSKTHITTEIILSADFSPGTPELFCQTPNPYSKNGKAMLTDVSPGVGDFFLAGGRDWSASVQASGVQLGHEIRIAPEKSWDGRFLLGCSSEATVPWLEEQLERWDTQTVLDGWTERLGKAKTRAPELWMREECLWNVGRLLSSSLSLGNTTPTTVFFPISLPLPGNASCLLHARPAIRDILSLVLPLTYCEPESALKNLTAASAAQGVTGKFPERIDQNPDESEKVERSDLEIAFLLAWTEFLSAQPTPEILDRTCPFNDGDSHSYWEHILRAYAWIRNEIREGPRGLLRILDGDWNGFLNAVGSKGKGESVLNSAMAAYAAQRLSAIARQRGKDKLAEELVDWSRNLRRAVGETYDASWFCRAYTDDDVALGDTDSDRIFASVQAWAVIARCGTRAQRRYALTSVLKKNPGDAAIRTISPPYPMPSSKNISSKKVLPGENFNGGISMQATAWMIWALTEENMVERAMEVWEQFSIRQRAACPDAFPMPVLSLDSTFAPVPDGIPFPGRKCRSALPESPLPNPHATAWQQFALQRILS